MAGIIYVVCTNVGRAIIKSHLKYHEKISIAGIINLNFEESVKKANYDSMYDIAKENNIDILYCKNINDDSTIDFIVDKKPNLIIQSGWSQKFSSKVLNIPKYGCIGEHPSPIPIGRGAAAVNWAIIEGEKRWGDTFFNMVEKYDAGLVYAQETFSIREEDTCRDVYDIVAKTSYYITQINLFDWYNGNFNPIELDESKATYYKKRTPKDGEISFNWSLKKIIRYINALTDPYPGAFFEFENEKFIIWNAKSTNLISSKKAGTVILIDDGSIYVTTGDSKVIKILSIEGTKTPKLSGSDFYKSIFGADFKEVNIFCHQEE